MDSIIDTLAEKMETRITPEKSDLMCSQFSTSTAATDIPSLMGLISPSKAKMGAHRKILKERGDTAFEADDTNGITSIILEGSVEDWEKLQKNIKRLHYLGPQGQFTDKLRTVIQNIINTSKGVESPYITKFWREMVVVGNYTNGLAIGGWITQFFPHLPCCFIFPREKPDWTPLCECALRDLFGKGFNVYSFALDDEKEKINYDLVAGFVGVKQNKKDLSISTEIGFGLHRSSNRASRLLTQY